MRTIVIAEPDRTFADRLAQPLRTAGYRVATCPGPWPPELRCIRCDIGYCPLTEGADLLIYNPDLLGYGIDGAPHLLALDTGEAHPDVPLLLAWAGEEEPSSVARILATVPNALRAASDPAPLLDQVKRLIGGPTDLITVQLHLPDAHVVG
jgi:hypothetical protein